MLRSTLSAATARSSACRDASAFARARGPAPSRNGCVAMRRVWTSYPASLTVRLAPPLGERRVALHELGREPVVQAEHVVQHEHLTVARRTRPDADCGDRE